MNVWRFVLFLLMFPMILSAENIASQSVNSDETLHYIASFPDELDPVYSTTKDHYRIIPELFEGLVSSDRNGNIVPEVATGWQISDDGKVARFTLRDTFWSDGMPVIAQNFVDAFRRIFDPSVNKKGKPTYLYYDFVNAAQILDGQAEIDSLGVLAIDDKTLELQLTKPTNYLISLLLNPSFAPVPSHVIKEHGERWTDFDRIVVNGPFLPTEQDVQRLRLEKNTAYWRGDDISFKVVEFLNTESKVGRDSILTGKAQVMDVSVTDDFEKLNLYTNSSAFQILESPLVATTFIALNLSDEKLKNIKVRQALSLGLDRNKSDHLVSTYGFSVDAGSIGWKRYKPEIFSRLDLDERMVLANKLMTEAGYSRENPLDLEISHAPGNHIQKEVRRIAHQWYKLGVNLTLRPISNVPELFDNVLNNDYETAWLGWHADFDDPQNFFSVLGVDPSYSLTSWKNQDFLDLFDQLEIESDPKRRVEISGKLEALIADEVPIIPVYNGKTLTIAGQRMEFGSYNYLEMLKIKHMRLNLR